MGYDYDLLVVGGGSGGVRAARIAASYGAKVAIAEEHRYGGTCVIRGCVPKKLFVYASEFGNLREDARGYGWQLEGHFDWAELRKRKDAEIDRLNGIYIELLSKNGVEMLNGHAELTGKNSATIADKNYTADKILLATGATPRMPDIPGVDLAISSNEAFYLNALPKRVAVVGGGYIGLEFANIFLGLGVEVTLVHHRTEVLRGFDEDVRHEVTANVRREGMRLLFDTEIASIEKAGSALRFTCRDGGTDEVDTVMFAIGRIPATANLGLNSAGVSVGGNGEILVDEYSQTNVSNIYAVGDCTGAMALTPVAIRYGQAFADTVFGGKPTTVDLTNVPTAIFCQPEVGTVGLTEDEARTVGPIRVYQSRFRPLFHTLTGRDEKVMIKVIVNDSTDQVIGMHIVGHGAAEVVQAAAVAIKAGATKAVFDDTIALHPTTAEELVLMRQPVDPAS